MYHQQLCTIQVAAIMSHK